MTISTIFITAALSAILYILIIAISIAQLRCCKTRIAEPIAWLSAGLFGLVYQIIFMVDYSDGKVVGMTYNYWSIAVRVDFLVTLLIIDGARYYRMKTQNGR